VTRPNDPTTRAATAGAIIGWVLILSAGLVYGDVRLHLAQAAHAPGRILSQECHDDSDGDEVCQFIAGFLTPDGVPHRFTYGSLDLPDVGDAIDMYYHPEDPDSDPVTAVRELWAFCLALFAVGWILFGRWWTRLLDLSDHEPASGTRPIQLAAAVAGALLGAAAWWHAGPNAPGLYGAAALLVAALLGAWLTRRAAPKTEVVYAPAGYSIFAAGAASLVGAFAFIPSSWIWGWLIAVPLVLLLAAPLHLALWGRIARAVIKVTAAQRLRDDARRALRGGDRVSTMLVRFRRSDGENAILGRRDDRGESDVLAAASVLPAGISMGTWLLIYEPVWGRRPGATAPGYRDGTWEESIEGVGQAVSLGPSVEELLEGRPASLTPFLALAGLAMAATLAAFVGATWVLSPTFPPRVPPPTSFRDAVTVEGAVSETTDDSMPRLLTRCTVTVSPVTDLLFNCRAEVVCGWRSIYGANGSGLAACGVANGRPVSARGGSGSAGDPSVRVDLSSGRVWVGPRSDGGQWRAVIALDNSGGD